MAEPIIQGWCPGALRPMPSGDGWVIRVRPPNGRLAPNQAREIARLARAHGNGVIDLSSRANIHLRGDFLQIAREFNKTCLLITHRIDDALEMADRAIVLSPPARIALELEISAEARADPAKIAVLHAQIAAAMGEEPDTRH